MNKYTDAGVWISAIAEIARRFAWLPIAVLLMHEAAAHVFNLYQRWPPIDIPLHLVGGFAIAYFCSGAIEVLSRRELINLRDLWVRWLLTFALVCMATVFWEFAERTADHTIGTSCQIGLDDTMLDMFCGVVGGSVYIVLSILRGNGKESSSRGIEPVQ